MEQKLNSLYDFLNANRSYNQALQKKYCYKMIGNNTDPFDRLVSMLYFIVNTQSQPKIDKITAFFQKVYSLKDREAFNSFNGTVKFLSGAENGRFEDLFIGLRVQPGWGDKTAALFTKNIYLIHNTYMDNDLTFWKDVPKNIDPNEKFYLPVDTVIESIFYQLDSSVNWNFSKINNLLNLHYNNEQIEVWDDLWFWGFINQKGSDKKNRKIQWNEGKYWIMEESDKNQEIIDKIKFRSAEFRKLIN